MIPAAYPFYAIALSGMGYFALARRTFDFTALAFFASCFYFIPGFAGVVGYPEAVIMRPVPVLPETYAVMCLVLGALLLSGGISDLFPMRSVAQVTSSNRTSRTAVRVATVLAVAGAAVTWATMGNELNEVNKFQLLQELNRWYLLWTSCATIGVVLAYRCSSRALFVLNALLLFLDLYIGFRVELVVTALTVATLFLYNTGPARLAHRWRLAVLVLCLALLMFVYKAIIIAVKLGNWDVVIGHLNNSMAWQQVFFYSEPFIVQGILNEVIRVGYTVSMTHFSGIALLLVPFSNEFGGQPVGFSELFQPVIFSSVTEAGVGSNIWAEMLASGGWYLLTLAVLAYCAVLVAGSRVLASLSKELSSVLAIVLVYWAFYIHRNDLLFQLTLTRRVLLAGAAVIGLATLLGLAAREWRRAVHPVHQVHQATRSDP